MSIFCPFCLTEHVGNKCDRGGETKKIPQAYIKAIQKGVPIYPISVIGYTGCGKTTYLSSLIYALYNKLPKEWISIFALNQETIKKIEEDYIPRLMRGNFPPPTAQFFEEPLILKLTIPEKKFNIIPCKRETILVMYDTKGGTYDTVDAIKDNFPLIGLIPNLILLVDLHCLCTETTIPVDMKLHSIVNKLTLALGELHSTSDSATKKKNLIICFTKTDKFWDLKGAKEDFGPLAHRPSEPQFDLRRYCEEEICKASNNIQKNVVEKKYNNFFEMINEHYGGYCFVASSNIGCKPDEKTNTFRGEYNPLRVVDPILWFLTVK
jgi:hypothetical protein